MARIPLEEFDAVLAQYAMRGQWKSEEFLERAIGGPKPAGTATAWKWSTVQRLLDRAGEALPESIQARRSLIFQDQTLPRGTTHTINMGVQMISPREVAWAHRHSIAALRFIIQGHPQLFTIVDGEKCEMEDGDLVLTPNWTWHDHHNLADEPAYWLDVLDVPLVLGLNQVFFEPGKGAEQPQVDRDGPPRKLRYRWRDVELELMEAPLSAHDGKMFVYRNEEGGPTLSTLGCSLHFLPTGFATAPRRRTSSAVYFVVRGEGSTKVGDKTIYWGKRDSFTVPNWLEHRHVCGPMQDAVLFCVQDAPTIQALGLFREELR
jgi:1-hydroxy-2-naphthoate dioxygenase